MGYTCRSPEELIASKDVSERMSADRYSGKPFLRLLECYVLDAIGALDEQQRTVLQRMEPKLMNVYGRSGSWSEIVAAEMEFPPSLPMHIRQIWTQNIEAAKSRGLRCDPNEFALAFVDQNFPDLDRKSH